MKIVVALALGRAALASVVTAGIAGLLSPAAAEPIAAAAGGPAGSGAAVLATAAPTPSAAPLVAPITARPPIDKGPVYMAPTQRSAIDEAFIAARKAMLDNDLDGVEKAAARIPREHPLRQYADYWRLRVLLGPKRVEALTGGADTEVRAFLARHADTIAADLLRRDWMLALGRRGDWATFDAIYPQWQLRDESAPACYAQVSALSRLPLGQPLPAATARAARELVMQPAALNRACTELLTALAARNELKAADLRQRLQLALEANAPTDIRLVALLLQPTLGDRPLEQALNKPAAALKAGPARELRLIALTRLARNDPAEAAGQMAAAAAALPADERRFVWSQIAASGQRRMHAVAPAWAKESVQAKVSDETRVWLARAALRAQDWPLLRRIVLAMDESTRSDPTWVYWLGRERKATGHPKEAQALFQSISNRHDFYAKLAREELGLPIEVPSRPDAPAAELIARWDQEPGMTRTLAFYALGMRFEGNREWNYTLRGRPEPELRSAALWAMQRRLLDRAINTDERIRSDADFTLRFPAPFAEQLLPIAKGQGLDAAWVYGLIRQESRFIMDARSHVGASGLMQLMPATARWVAKRLGRTDYTQASLNDLQTNLEFGSYYLRQALDDLDGSPVLASAGYNAGPNRARNWRASLDAPLEGAIFAEIIPFSETRGYVKNVMSNATDYAAMFSGQPQSLKAWLGTIEPKVAGTTALP